MISNRSNSAPVFVVGCMRSGKTTLRRALQLAVAGDPGALSGCFVELADEDGEGRTFWQASGLHIGARRTGSECLHAGKSDVTEAQRKLIGSRVSSLCADGRYLISDNAHLLNKIGFVAEVLPESRFILVLHDLESMVGAMKRGFTACNIDNEDYPPFVHYWPDCGFPCWTVLRNDKACSRFSKQALRRGLADIVHGIGWKGCRVEMPARSRPQHALLSEFQKEHPDPTRYYPGAGFRRLPESWLTLNDNALRQLQELPKDRWTVVSHEALLEDPAATLRDVLEFLNWRLSDIGPAVEWIDPARARAYAARLTDDERSIIRKVIAENRGAFERVTRHLDHAHAVDSIPAGCF